MRFRGMGIWRRIAFGFSMRAQRTRKKRRRSRSRRRRKDWDSHEGASARPAFPRARESTVSSSAEMAVFTILNTAFNFLRSVIVAARYGAGGDERRLLRHGQPPLHTGRPPLRFAYGPGATQKPGAQGRRQGARFSGLLPFGHRCGLSCPGGALRAFRPGLSPGPFSAAWIREP